LTVFALEGDSIITRFAIGYIYPFKIVGDTPIYYFPTYFLMYNAPGSDDTSPLTSRTVNADMTSPNLKPVFVK